MRKELKMKKIKKLWPAVICCALALMLCNVGNVFASGGFTPPDGKRLTSLKEYSIAPGITEQHITTVDSKGSNQVQGYAATVDLSKSTGILAGYKDYDTSGKWGLQTVRDQAAAAQKKTDKNIVVAVNGDYFNMSTGEPTGVLVMNGKVVKGESWEYYFAITKDGKAEIRNPGDPLDDIKEAVGGPIRLVKDGKIAGDVDKNAADLMPRNAVGVKADGTVVLFGADGRQAPKSVGLSYYETAEMMLQLGCKDAIYIDGGGSYTYASKSEGTDELTVKNSPSDGIERKVSSTIFVYSDAKSTGEFDHASISPYNEVYTPGSTVEFKAVGVDSAGGKAVLPSNVKYALKDPDMGTISDDGVFEASEKTGTVEIQLKSGDDIVGKTSIEIRHPDKIQFADEEVTLGFDAESDLGLVATWNGRSVNTKYGDFEWTCEHDQIKEGDKFTFNGKNVIVSESKLHYFEMVKDGNNSRMEIKDELTEDEVKAFDGTVMGSFRKGSNIFLASSDNSINGTITCRYKEADPDLSAKVRVIIGKKPTVIMDFEDHTDESGNVTSAKDYWNFGRAVVDANGGNILKLWNSKSEVIDKDNPEERMITAHYCNKGDPDNSRGGEESAELVDIASEEPVRFGNYALKLNYDFTKINGIEGACVGFSQPDQEIPGNPSAIGMYMYAPEGTPNLWPRIRVKDSTGTVLTLNFKPQSTGTSTPEELGGIDYTGWQYLEASFEGKSGPFTLLGGETIRIMHTDGAYNGMGDWIVEDGKVVKRDRSQCKGSVYIDNVQFVYGSNTGDTDSPVISDIRANNEVLEEDKVIKSNDVSFTVSAKDIENKYTSGLDYKTANIWLDGRNMQNNESFAYDSSKNELYLYDQHLSNGSHTIKALIRDSAGNEATKSIGFDVDGTTLTAPRFKLAPGEKAAYIGEYANLVLSTDQPDAVETVSAVIKLGKGFSEYEVSYGDAYEQEKAPVYNKKNNTVQLFMKKKTGAKAEEGDPVAVLNVKIPENVSENAKLSYSVTSGEYTYRDEDGADQEKTFTVKTGNVGMKSRYTLDIGKLIVGADAKITVKTEAGRKAPDMTICTTDGEELGVTDINGTFTTSRFRTVQRMSIYAKDKSGKRSFTVSCQSYNTGANKDGTPTFIQLNAAKDSETTKNISWMSDPGIAEKAAVAKVALKSDYEAKKDAAFKEYSGNCDFMEFNGSAIAEENRIVYMNSVEVKGLRANKSYVCKLGDGDEHWSDVIEFKTAYNGEDTKFFIIGDTQAEDTTVISNIAEALSKDKYTFGVQTGDFVEKPTIYSDWENILKVFDNDAFKSVDMIHATGNHELFGDSDGTIQKGMFNIGNRNHYSATYGNVYVAVIGYAVNENEAKEAAEWLVSDASKSSAKWKIVVSHQPPYGTNEAATDCDYIHKYIPDACDDAGIDFVFSGHDHALVRTEPVKAGKVDEENGVVYYVCGSTGEKSYTPSNKRGYPFAEEPTNEYDGIYLTVNASDSQFRVNVHDADGSLLENYCYTKTKETCKNGLHEYYSTDDEHLVCKVCGISKLINDSMTGVVVDRKTGLARYLQDGKFVKEQWVINGDDSYYMDDSGYSVTGTVKIDGRKYTFNRKGLFVKGSFVNETVTMKDGKQKEITRYYTAGGIYAVRWHEIDGNLYHFRKNSNQTNPDDGEMFKGGEMKIKTPGSASVTTRSFKFDDNGVLIRGAFEDEKDSEGNLKGTRYYWGDSYVKKSTVIEGVRYDFDPSNGYMKVKDINGCSISKIGDQTYTGKALKPVIKINDSDCELVQGTNFNVTYRMNKNVGTAKVTVEGNESRGYKGTIQKTFRIKPGKAVISSVKNSKEGSLSVTWKAVKGAGGYKVYRASSKNGTYKSVKTVKSAKTLTYTNTKLSKGRTYYYKVRAYKKGSDGKTVYGDYSKIKSLKVKK